MEQDKEKPLQEPDSVQTTILTPTAGKHSPGGTEKRFKPKAQGKGKGTGEEERSKHPLRAQATPSTLAQQGESGLNPKWVWLFRFSNDCLPPPEVSSSSQVLPHSLTPLPHPRFSGSALERPTASPLSHALVKKLWPQQFIWAQTISRPNDRPFCSQLSLNQVSGGPLGLNEPNRSSQS